MPAIFNSVEAAPAAHCLHPASAAGARGREPRRLGAQLDGLVLPRLTARAEGGLVGRERSEWEGPRDPGARGANGHDPQAMSAGERVGMAAELILTNVGAAETSRRGGISTTVFGHWRRRFVVAARGILSAWGTTARAALAGPWQERGGQEPQDCVSLAAGNSVLWPLPLSE